VIYSRCCSQSGERPALVEPFALMNLARRPLILLVLSLSMLLCSCAGLPGADHSFVTDGSRPLGPAVDAFSISGRLLLKQGQRRDHLRFTWDHTVTADTLLLNTALGQGVAKLTRNNEKESVARLDLADGKVYQATNWQALSQQVFGQALPLDVLPQWLRGAYPQWRGEAGKWQIVVSEAQALPSTAGRQHQLMPRIIQMSSDDVVLNVVIESWGADDE
jgi:outer membrane lipoprotein LolB